MQKTKGKDLLDVGCGTGDFIKHMRKNGWKVDGVETDKQARGLAKKEVGLSIYSSIEDKRLNKYDVITMWHVLEHVYDLDSFLSRIGSLLKKNGILVIGVPNSNSYDAAYYGENWFAYDLPIHVSHFRKNDIQNIFKKHDLKLKAIKPLVFDAYYISMLSEQKAKHSSLFGLVRGFTSNTKAKKSGEYSSLTYYLFK